MKLKRTAGPHYSYHTQMGKLVGKNGMLLHLNSMKLSSNSLKILPNRNWHSDLKM